MADRGGKIEVDIHAKYIISDAGVVNTFKTLLPQEVAQKSCMFFLLSYLLILFSSFFLILKRFNCLPGSIAWGFQRVFSKKLFMQNGIFCIFLTL